MSNAAKSKKHTWGVDLKQEARVIQSCFFRPGKTPEFVRKVSGVPFLDFPMKSEIGPPAGGRFTPINGEADTEVEKKRG